MNFSQVHSAKSRWKNSLDAQAIIGKKRDGLRLTVNEIDWFCNGLASGEVSDAQAGAFAMAITINDMNNRELVALTEGMLNSGVTLDWDLPGPVLDKHSTGGVGDCTSLLLAPALAACGAFVPMVSGRGLGHTGGTLDKLDSITGYKTQVSTLNFKKIVKEVGCAIVSANDELAPADKRLYGIRDVTGTVENIALISSSILSKKLASGIDGLILDIKSGSGAVMQDLKASTSLAKRMVEIGQKSGCSTTAFITNMDQPLASCAGNSLEIMTAMNCLTMDKVDPRLLELTISLGGSLLKTAGISKSVRDGEKRIQNSIESGLAAETFGRMVSAMGGPSNFTERYKDLLPEAATIVEVHSQSVGFVSQIDVKKLGLAVVALGGGRKRQDDKLDLSVGLDQLVPLGQKVSMGSVLARVHGRDEGSVLKVSKDVARAYTISEAAPEKTENIISRIFK